MTQTVQASRNLIPLENPNWTTDGNNNGWKVTYRPSYTFMISECYLKQEEITREILNLHTEYTLNRDRNNPAYDNKMKSLFAKFKDFEVHDVVLEHYVNQRTVSNPLIIDFNNNNPRLVEGVCHITFNFIMYQNDSASQGVPKQITLKNMPVKAHLEKTNQLYHWKLDLDSSIVYYQMLLIIKSTNNLETTFLELNNLEREKINDLEYYFNKINDVIVLRQSSYMSQ